ncbi:MAG: hypothetical protein GZ087_14805 [Flavobacterium sp.]|nr:hypothetical protein [Flavobacterium sp.]
MMKITIDTRLHFLGFFLKYESYGIDVFYNRKYQFWLISNSTDAEYLDKEDELPQYDNDGFITNVKFTPFEKSVPLTEKDFIQNEFKVLSFFDVEKLRSDQLRLLNYYKVFLTNKSNNPFKLNKKILELKDFFDKDFDENKIQMIKERFKDLTVGKKMAHLIYILHTERKLIVYYANDKTRARKHFIQALTESNKRTAGVDEFFENNNTTLKDPSFKKDGDYSTIKNQLEAIIDIQ